NILSLQEAGQTELTLFSLQAAGQTELTSSTFQDAKGDETPPFTQGSVRLATLTYDATAVGGTMRFSVTGLGTFTETTTNPTTKGYTETDSFSLQNGVGQGVDRNGNTIFLNGFTLTAIGAIKF